MRYKFRPNSTQKKEYIDKIKELEAWIANEGCQFRAERALTGTVYFTIEGQRYRVASHKPGFNFRGEINFHAAPTRAPEIAAAILAGKQLDGRGKEKCNA